MKTYLGLLRVPALVLCLLSKVRLMEMRGNTDRSSHVRIVSHGSELGRIHVHVMHTHGHALRHIPIET